MRCSTIWLNIDCYVPQFICSFAIRMNGNISFNRIPNDQDQGQVLETLYHQKDFADVTLVSDDGKEDLHAHRVILASVSEVFRSLLDRHSQAQSMLYMRGVKHENIALLLDFIYRGAITVPMKNLGEFMSLAQDLKITGLANGNEQSLQEEGNVQPKNEEFLHDLTENLKKSEEILLNLTDNEENVHAIPVMEESPMVMKGEKKNKIGKDNKVKRKRGRPKSFQPEDPPKEPPFGVEFNQGEDYAVVKEEDEQSSSFFFIQIPQEEFRSYLTSHIIEGKQKNMTKLTCDICEYFYSSLDNGKARSHLEEHVGNKHGQIFSFYCRLCFVKHTSYSAIVKHVKCCQDGSLK